MCRRPSPPEHISLPLAIARTPPRAEFPARSATVSSSPPSSPVPEQFASSSRALHAAAMYFLVLLRDEDGRRTENA